MRERTVFLPASYKAGDQEYRVIDGDGEPPRVYAVCHLNPVSKYGNYQVDTSWRKIKAGGRKWAEVVRKAENA